MSASVYVCQGGCGKFEEDITEMNPRGIVSEKLYCNACIEEIDEYLTQRDELHSHLANEWSEKLFALQGSYDKEGRSLPDAP